MLVEVSDPAMTGFWFQKCFLSLPIVGKLDVSFSLSMDWPATTFIVDNLVAPVHQTSMNSMHLHKRKSNFRWGLLGPPDDGI